MKDNGKTAKQMVSGNMIYLMVPHISAIGKIIKLADLEHFYTLMATSLKDLGQKIKYKGMGNTLLKMDLCTKENGKMINQMEQEHKHMMEDGFMKVFILTYFKIGSFLNGNKHG
jgi:hypothetical protein